MTGAEAMQPLAVVGQAHQGPFGGYLVWAAQQELAPTVAFLPVRGKTGFAVGTAWMRSALRRVPWLEQDPQPKNLIGIDGQPGTFRAQRDPAGFETTLCARQ